MRNYTRWVETVQVRGSSDQHVYVSLNPKFEQVWLAAKRYLPEHGVEKSANLKLRSKYALRFYDWAKKRVSSGTQYIPLEDLRKVFGLGPVTDKSGNV